MKGIHCLMLEVNKVLRVHQLLEHVMVVEKKTICGGRPDTPSKGIRKTYPDKMLSFHPDTFHPDGSHSDSGSAPPLHPAAVITPDAAITSGCHHFTPRCDILLPPTFHPDVHIRNSDAGWERRRFKFPEWTYSDSLIAPYPDRRAAILHKCCSVLLKLPDICHQHFGIF
ncbi:hypothetical protein CK203_036917 [Vitis vinifera]|uniref:Uncharacterized protein n=1 Tax=Vitis vinifera TaxID=29760 RepID=A0A438IUX5_VITVI|nr:hypothetical protein CK203_036917 [Vitis vinifera]